MSAATRNGWKNISLGEVATLQRGYDLPVQQRREGHVPVVAATSIVGSHHLAKVRGPGVVTGRSGSIGNVQFIEEDYWPLNTTLYVKDFHDNHPRFVYHLLRNLQLDRYHEGTGVPTLNRNNIHSIEVALPPLAEQRRIAAILDQAEALRAKRRRAIERLDSLTQSIFLEMFGDPAVNPKNWDALEIRGLSQTISDGPFGSNLKTEHYVAEGIRVVRLQNIGVDEFVDDDQAYISAEHYKTLQKHTCRPGDVLIGTLGDPNLRACIQPDWLDIAINKADCVQLRPDPEIATAEYVCALLNQPSTKRMAQSLVLGQTRARISMGRLRSLEVPVPPIGLQRDFAQRLQRVRILKKEQHRSVLATNNLFASLQQRAFAGGL